MFDKLARLEALKDMYNTVEYDGHIYIIGKGAIGTNLLYMILKLFKISPSNISIIDSKNLIDEIPIEYINNGLNFINKKVDDKNYKEIFRNVKENDMIVDCSYDVSTLDIIKLCQEKGCSYINSSIETWNYRMEHDPIKFSIYARYKELMDYSNSLSQKRFNAITGMGCNPGMVSIWVKVGLDKMNEQYKHQFNSYGELSQKLGVKTIHISEIDTQRTNDGKKSDEYCNTWSLDGEAFYEEALAPIEMSWGTHETNLPNNVAKYFEDERYLVVDKQCITQYAQSYCPLSKNFIGMMIRHEENMTIGDTLTIKQDGKIVYKPTVFYVYHPCNDTMMSLYELKEKNYTYQHWYRLLTTEIIDGRDELGITFFMENGDIFWIGSLLDIDEAREVCEHKLDHFTNATIIQVIGGYLSGIFYLIQMMYKKKYVGVLCADDLPHQPIFEKMKPFYGDFSILKVTDWDFNKRNRVTKFMNIEKRLLTEAKPKWTLDEFLI